MNKRGLSTVVTTLIIILLVLVAIGIVWVVVRNIIQGGAEGVELSSKCLNIDVRATAVDCGNPEACKITFERTGSNNDAIGGVKLVFFDETENSGVIDEPGNIETLAGKTITIDSTLLIPNKLEVTAYFKDESGSSKSCSTTSSDIDEGTGGGEEPGGGGTSCGDGSCNGDETCETCEEDCGECSGESCGDEICQSTETCSTCEADCGSCEGDYCGDESCNGDETCETCEADCGCEEEEICVLGICLIETVLDSGTVGSVWPSGAVKYFDSEDLPKDSVTISAFVLGYAKFPGSSETRCLQITWAEYLVEYDRSYLRLESVAEIVSGDEYEIWATQEGCEG